MTTRVPANKGRRYPAETLSPDEVRALLKAIRGESSTALRDRALIAVTYRGALRISEALALKPHDIDLDAGTLRILNGKGGRHRLVAIDGEAVALLRAWIERRRSLGIGGRSPLFCTLKGTKLHASHVRRLLHRLSPERRVVPHTLRHSRASELAQEGVPLPVIQKILGHTHLSTTARYLDHVSPTDVINAMTATDWKLDP